MTVLAILLTFASAQSPSVKTHIPAPAPRVWIYNATQSDSGAKLDLWIDGTPSSQAVEPDSTVGPFTVANPASASVAVRKSGGSSDLASDALSLGANDEVVVVSGDPGGKMTLKELAIAPTAPDDKRAQVSVMNATEDTLDFYLVEPNDTIDRAHPTLSAMNPGSTAVAAPSAGSYRVEIVTSATKNDPILSQPFSLNAGWREVVLALPGASESPDRVVILHL